MPAQLLIRLLKRTAKTDKPSRDGMTALMLAAANGHSECVGWLLLAGADTSLRDARGRTALAHALLRRQWHAAVALAEWERRLVVPKSAARVEAPSPEGAHAPADEPGGARWWGALVDLLTAPLTPGAHSLQTLCAAAVIDAVGVGLLLWGLLSGVRRLRHGGARPHDTGRPHQRARRQAKAQQQQQQQHRQRDAKPQRAPAAVPAKAPAPAPAAAPAKAPAAAPVKAPAAAPAPAKGRAKGASQAAMNSKSAKSKERGGGARRGERSVASAQAVVAGDEAAFSMHVAKAWEQEQAAMEEEEAAEEVHGEEGEDEGEDTGEEQTLVDVESTSMSSSSGSSLKGSSADLTATGVPEPQNDDTEPTSISSRSSPHVPTPAPAPSAAPAAAAAAMWPGLLTPEQKAAEQASARAKAKQQQKLRQRSRKREEKREAAQAELDCAWGRQMPPAPPAGQPRAAPAATGAPPLHLGSAHRDAAFAGLPPRREAAAGMQLHRAAPVDIEPIDSAMGDWLERLWDAPPPPRGGGSPPAAAPTARAPTAAPPLVFPGLSSLQPTPADFAGAFSPVGNPPVGGRASTTPLPSLPPIHPSLTMPQLPPQSFLSPTPFSPPVQPPLSTTPGVLPTPQSLMSAGNVLSSLLPPTRREE